MLRPDPLRVAQLLDLSPVAGKLPCRCPARGAYRLMNMLGIPEAWFADWGLPLENSSQQRIVIGKVESEAMYRAASAWLMAYRVFADVGKAQRFLSSPHPYLSGSSPIEVSRADEDGLRAVEELLGRLYFGTAA